MAFSFLHLKLKFLFFLFLFRLFILSVLCIININLFYTQNNIYNIYVNLDLIHILIYNILCILGVESDENRI